MRTVFYLTAASRLQPGTYYQRNAVTPIVILKDHGTNLFRSDYDWRPAVSAVASRLAGPWHAGLWSEDTRTGRTLAPWDWDAAWGVLLGNLKALAGILPAASGVFFDGEIYTSTPGGSGGLMDASAWPAGEKAGVRGMQVRKAIGDRPLGQYVLVSDAKGHPGWRQFWGAAFKPGDLLLDESGYLKGAQKATAFAGARGGVRNLPGRTLVGGKLERGRVPKGDFWIWPQGPGLEKVSGKWR